MAHDTVGRTQAATLPFEESTFPAPDTPPQQGLCVAGLFSGIGGFEFGLHQAGHRSVLMCENDPSARAVLKSRFDMPLKRIREDVTKPLALPPETDLLVAGFPCQDLSQAGTGRGLDGPNSGLVRRVFELLKRKRVEWVLIENVPFMLHLARGRALDEVLRSLEGLGYRWAYRVVDAMSFGVPQRRRRVFILASLHCDPRSVLLADDAPRQFAPKANGTVACGFYWTEGNRGLGWAEDAIPTLKGGSAFGIPSPPAIWRTSGEIIKPDIRDAERLQGFEEDWTLPAAEAGRMSLRWRLVGNAVNVRVSEWIGRRLAEPGHYSDSRDRRFARGGRWPTAAWSLGEGVFASSVSEWPEPHAHESLEQFLRFDGEPLSVRAAGGFRERLNRSALDDRGLVSALDQHVARNGPAPSSPST